MKSITVLSGNETKTFTGVDTILIPKGGDAWIPEDEAIKYVKTEEIKITKNGTYYPPKGTFYSKVKVNIRKKKKGGSGSDNGDGTPTSKDVTISQVRTNMTFPGVQIITTNSTNEETIKWIPKEDAGYYVKTEALNVSDNDIYIPEEGVLYKSVTVNVELDDDDPNDPDNPGGGDNPGGKTELKLITKEITANGTYNAADEGVDGYSSVVVNVVAAGKNKLGRLTIEENGRYNPANYNVDGWNEVQIQRGKFYEVKCGLPYARLAKCAVDWISSKWNVEPGMLSNLLTFPTEGCDFYDISFQMGEDKAEDWPTTYTCNYSMAITVKGFRSSLEMPFFTAYGQPTERQRNQEYEGQSYIVFSEATTKNTKYGYIYSDYTAHRTSIGIYTYSFNTPFEIVSSYTYVYKTERKEYMPNLPGASERPHPSITDLFTAYSSEKNDVQYAENYVPHVGAYGFQNRVSGGILYPNTESMFMSSINAKVA